MYEQFFGLSENPFSLTPDSRFIFSSRSHDEALAHLRYWVEHREGFAMITGEVGTGKTTALFRLIEGMERHYEIAFLTNSTLTAVELLEEICRKFRIEVDRELTKPALLSRLEAYLVRLHEMGHGAVLIIDEAQNFDHHLLEEVRLLSNVTRPGGSPLLQIALIGQPELERKLSSPELRQLKQRIGVHYRIEPLSTEETARYIHHRVTVAGGYPRVLFPAETLNLLYERTHGLPREINQVASQSLLHAYVEESTSVRPDHVRSAIEEMNFRSVLERGVTLTVAPNPGTGIAGRAPAPPGPGLAGTMTRPSPGPTPASHPLSNPAPAGPPPRSTPIPVAAPAGRAALPSAGPPNYGGATEPTRVPPVDDPVHETAAAVPAPARFRPEPIGGRAGRGSRVRNSSFGAVPPVGTVVEGSGEVRNPLLRRLLMTAGAIAILGLAAFLLFAPPKIEEGVSDLAAEPTSPSGPATQGDRPAPPLSGATTAGPAVTTPPTGGSGTVRETSPPAPAITTTPTPAVRDSVPQRPPATGAESLRGFYLQVASFRDSLTAEQHGRGLASRTGHVHRVERSGSDGSPWFALYVGPFVTTAEAESGRVELSRIDSSLADAIVRDRR